MIKITKIKELNISCGTCKKGKAKYTLYLPRFCCNILVGETSHSLCEKCFKKLKKEVLDCE